MGTGTFGKGVHCSLSAVSYVTGQLQALPALSLLSPACVMAATQIADIIGKIKAYWNTKHEENNQLIDRPISLIDL